MATKKASRRKPTRKKAAKKRVSRKTTTRKKHSVKGSLQLHQLTKAGTSIEFRIYAGNRIIGHMIIGRGSLTWYGRKRHKRKQISWSRFAQLMDEFAYGD